ncbi:hypothetical protein LCGC14_2069880 [marine sediment metagenome]|uniref:Uncharacterized protein n=1 Tax=marine sediment metagenome TaxID=412755 RepID=A0A0F9EIV9_9ZZZZ
MEARGDTIESIPSEALLIESQTLQRGVVTSNSAITQTFLSAIRQERLLLRLCVAMEAIAGELVVPAPKPKGKG